MVAIGHLIGYGVGTLDLTKLLGTFLGDSQFKQMTVVAALALLIAVGVTSYAVQERILVSAKYSAVSVHRTYPCLTLLQRPRHRNRRCSDGYEDIQDDHASA